MDTRRIFLVLNIAICSSNAFPKPKTETEIRNDERYSYEDRKTNEAGLQRTIIDKCKEVVLKFDQLVEEVERKL